VSDPKRLIEQPGQRQTVAHALIMAGKRISPPADAEERGWRAISMSLGSGPFPSFGGSEGSPALPSGSGTTNGSGILSGGGAASKATGATVSASASSAPLVPAAAIKTFVVGAALGASTVTGVRAIEHATSPAPESATIIAPQRTTIAVPTTSEAVAMTSSATLPSSVPQVGAPSISTAHHMLRGPETLRSPSVHEQQKATASFPAEVTKAESSLVLEARDLALAKELLAEGHATKALAHLTKTSERFPSGSLTEERDVLFIEALARSGLGDLARQRARAFEASRPMSPLLERVRSLVAAP
jgi:hypothetical protein